MKRQLRLVIVGLVICAFTVGLITAPRPAQALGSKDILRAGLMIWGIGWVVKQFGPQINNFINNALGQHGAQVEGQTKVVPIFRLGPQKIGGVAVGAAQVVGPASQVEKVTYVLELEPLPNASPRVRALIPLSTKKNVTRSVKGIAGVGVSANIKAHL